MSLQNEETKPRCVQSVYMCACACLFSRPFCKILTSNDSRFEKQQVNRDSLLRRKERKIVLINTACARGQITPCAPVSKIFFSIQSSGLMFFLFGNDALKAVCVCFKWHINKRVEVNHERDVLTNKSM